MDARMHVCGTGAAKGTGESTARAASAQAEEVRRALHRAASQYPRSPVLT